MARSFTTIFSVAVCFLVLRTYGVQDANPLGPEPRLAFRVAGQRFLSNLTGISNLGKDVFARQSCGQGYGRCGTLSIHFCD
jgi:hypothetical protein